MSLATYTIAPALSAVLGETLTVECPAPRASTKGWDIRVRPDSRAAILASIATMLAQLPVQGSLDDNGQPQPAHPARAILADALAGNRLALATLATAGVEAYARPALAFRMIAEGDEGGHGGMPRHAQVVRMAIALANAKGLEEADAAAWEACQPRPWHDSMREAHAHTREACGQQRQRAVDALTTSQASQEAGELMNMEGLPKAKVSPKRKAKGKATA